jgi:RecA-family ATPase
VRLAERSHAEDVSARIQTFSTKTRQVVLGRLQLHGKYSTKRTNTMNWFNLKPPSNDWLVDGLITSDGHAAICGKPKAGKSTFVRNLIVSVIKGRQFIGRAIEIPAGPTGRVLYVHLDRKDQPGRVAEELRQLGIDQQESGRLVFRTAQEMPETFEERLSWIRKETTNAAPNLIVIDMLWQFVVAKNNNDYNAVIDGINKLQDALLKASYKGALIVTLHGRKAENPDDSFDDILGSTGQRGGLPQASC